jgi:hypothetical protein
MPRYLVERTFPEPLALPATRDGAEVCTRIGHVNARDGVHWVHSYVSPDKTKTWCIYDAPDPDAIRRTSAANEVPVDRITEVRVLDPFFHH